MISGPRFRIAVLCCFAVFFSSTAAFAQAVPQRRPLATDPAPAKAEQPATPMVSAGESELIEISLNKVKVISLDVPVGKIIVGNETIALPRTDPDDPTRIIIVSRAIGLTNFIFFDEKGAIIKQAEVRVFFDHGGIIAALAKLLPDETIEVTVFRDSVFLTGQVHSARAASNAVNIAGRFVVLGRSRKSRCGQRRQPNGKPTYNFRNHFLWPSKVFLAAPFAGQPVNSPQVNLAT